MIVGDGPARADLAARLGPHVKLAGYRTGDDLADHYAALDLFAFASRTETFGNVVLEAMASGLPVVALGEGGPRNTIQDHVTGLLVEPEATPEEFAQALISLVDHAERRTLMAQEARAFALTQTWDAIMTALRDRYLGLISTPVAVPAQPVEAVV
jgi:glycosyltransferase involved in cell wall biosynthesis